MDNEPLESIDDLSLGLRPRGAPGELRAPLLAELQGELRAARWDRRLARATVVLLAVGVGLNTLAGLRGEWSHDSQAPRLANRPSHRSIVETAVIVAETTDVETGRYFARQWAALGGRSLSGDELAAFDAAVTTRHSGAQSNGGDG